MENKDGNILNRIKKKSGFLSAEKVHFIFVKKDQERPFLLSVLFTTLKLIVFAFVVLCFAGLGLGAGIVKAYIDTTPPLDPAQVSISDRTSFLYDSNGLLITSIADVEYRDWVDIDEIPEMLQNAFISVEDVRFYKHNGVDFKRLFSAALEILGSSNSSGGSTITQQLIKNKILGSQRNYKRKIQEAYLAYKLEEKLSKEEILEAYLNDIYLGESNYGVKTAAMDYFGKELNQLTVRECAILAGLPQAPYTYNPRRNMYVRNKMEITNNRTNHVLDCMYKAGYITQEQYKTALTENTTIVQVSEQKQLYDIPYFVEYAIYDVATHMLIDRGLEDNTANRNAVENELRTGGYHIYTTVDRIIQETVQDSLATYDNYPTLADQSKSLQIETNNEGNVIETIEPQAAAVVIDYKTGDIKAVVGGREAPTIRKSLNRAYQSYTEIGSAVKPLAVYGPALELGKSPASVDANIEGPIPGWNTEKGYPGGGLDSHYGPVTYRRALMSSLNVPTARILMTQVTPKVGASYLERLGANMSKVNVDGPGLALGTSGLTPLQLTASYACIANKGMYLEPLSFTKVEDGEGNVILDADKIRRKEQVYKESTAYMLVDMMTDAVKSGTGTKARIDNMTVAGKTGTNSDYQSVYFVGITPYYVASVFIGHDYPVNKLKSGASGGTYAAPLWKNFMEPIHEGLQDHSIIEGNPEDFNLTKATICSISGKLATDSCKNDEEHKPVTDWFESETLPTEYCDMHVTVSTCRASGLMASVSCPPEDVTTTSYILIHDGGFLSEFDDEYLYKAIPNAIRTDMTADQFVEDTPTCPVHSRGSLGVFELKEQAEDLIETVEQYLRENRVDKETKYTLEYDIQLLQQKLSGYDYSDIESYMSTLKNDFNNAGDVVIVDD